MGLRFRDSLKYLLIILLIPLACWGQVYAPDHPLNPTPGEYYTAPALWESEIGEFRSVTFRNFDVPEDSLTLPVCYSMMILYRGEKLYEIRMFNGAITVNDSCTFRNMKWVSFDLRED